MINIPVDTTTDSLNLINLVLSTVALVSALSALTIWFRKWLRAQVSEPINEIKKEVTVNEGESLKDHVVSIDTKVNDHLKDHARERRRGWFNG